MRNEQESSDKKESDVVWRDCPVCRLNKAPSPQFKDFLPLVDHLIDHLYRLRHERPVRSIFEGDDLWRYRESLRRNPGTPPHLAEPLPPYDVDPLAWREPAAGIQPKILAEEKAFLPEIADWLEEALRSIREWNSIEGSELVGAERLVKLVTSLPSKFQEQREYLLEHKVALAGTVAGADWPDRAEVRARFVAESMAGARWGLKPSTSREYVRQERPKTGNALLELGVQKKEGRWWEPDLTKKDEEEKP